MDLKVIIESKNDLFWIEAFCDIYGYKNEILDNKGILVPNPQSKEDFATSHVIGFIQAIFRQWKVEQRVLIAREPQPGDDILITKG